LYSASKNRDKASIISPAPAFYTAESTPADEPASVSDLIQRAIYEASQSGNGIGSENVNNADTDDKRRYPNKPVNEVVALLQQIQHRVDADMHERSSPKRHITFASPTATPSSENKRFRADGQEGFGLDSGVKSRNHKGGYDRNVMDQYMNNQLELNAQETQYFDDKIEELAMALDEREAELEAANKALAQKDEELKFAKQEQSQNMNNQLDLQNSEMAAFEDQIITLSNALDEKDVEVAEKDQRLDELEKQVKALDAELRESKALILVKDVEIESIQASNDVLLKDLRLQQDEFTSQLAGKDQELGAQQDRFDAAAEEHREAIDALRWEMDDQKSVIELLEQKDAEAQDQLQQLSRQVSALNDQVLGLTDELAQEKAGFERSASECQQLAQALGEQQEKGARFEADLSAAVLDLNVARAEAKVAVDEARSQATAAEEARSQAIAAEEQCVRLQQDFDSTNEMLEKTEAALQAAETVSGDFEERLDAAQAAADESTAAREAAQSALAELGPQIDVLDTRNQSLQNEIATLKDRCAELSAGANAGAGEAAKHLEEIASLRDAVATKELELQCAAEAGVKQQKNITELYQQQLGQTQQVIEEQQQKIVDLSGRLHAASDAENNLLASDATSAELRKALALKDEELKLAKQELAQYMDNQLDLQSSEIATFEEQIITLSNALDEKDVEVAELQNSLGQKDDELKLAKQELAQYMDNQLDLQRGEMQTFEEQIVSLSNSLDEKDTKIATLTEEIEEHSGTMDALRWEMDDDKSEIETLKQKVGACEEQLRCAEAARQSEQSDSVQLQELQTEVFALRAANQEATARELALSEDLLRREQEVADLTGSLQRGEVELESLRDTLGATQARHDMELQTRLEELHRQLSGQTQADAESSASVAAGLQDQINELQHLLGNAQEEVAAAHSTAADLQDQIMQQEQTLQKQGVELEQLQAQVSGRESELDLGTPATKKHATPAAQSERRALFTPQSEIRKLQKVIQAATTPRRKMSKPNTPSRNPFAADGADAAARTAQLDMYMHNQLELNEAESNYYSEVIDKLVEDMEGLQGSIDALTEENLNLKQLQARVSLPSSPPEVCDRSQSSGMSIMEVTELQRSEQELRDRYEEQCIAMQQLDNEKSAAEQAVQELQTQLEERSLRSSRTTSVTGTPAHGMGSGDITPRKDGLVFDADFESFVKEAREMEEKYTASQASVEELTAQVAELQQINEQLEAANGEWNDYFATSSEQEEKAAAEIAELQQQIAELSQGSGSTESTVARHMQSIEELTAQVNELTEANQDLQSAGVDSAADNQKIEELTAQVAELQQANQHLESAVSEAVNSADSAADNQKIEELTAQVAELQQINEQLEAANGEWNDYYMNTQSDLETLNADIASRDAEIVQLVTRCDELRVDPTGASAAIQAEDADRLIAELEARLAQKETELDEVSVRLDQAGGDGAGSDDADIGSWKGRVASLEAQLADSQEEIVAIREANEQYQVEYEAVVQQNDEIKALNNETVDEYARLKASFEASVSGLNSSGMNTSMSQSSAHVRTLESEKDELKLSVSATRRERDEARLEADQLRNRLSSKEARIEKLLADMERQQQQHRNDKFHAMEAASHSFSNSTNVSTMSLSNTPRASDAQRRVQHLEIENNSLRQSIEEKVRELETEHDTNVYLRQLVENIETSEESIVQLQQEKAALFEQVLSSEEAVRQGSLKVKTTQDQYDVVVADLQLRVAHSKASVDSYEARVAELEGQLKSYQSQMSSMLAGTAGTDEDGMEVEGPNSSIIHQLNSKMEKIVAEKCAVEKACHDSRLEALNLEELLGSSRTHAAALEKYLQSLAKHVSLVQGSISKQQDSLCRQVDIWMNKFDERLSGCTQQVAAVSAKGTKTTSALRETTSRLQEDLRVALHECAEAVQEKRDALVQLNHAEHRVGELEQTVEQYKHQLSSPTNNRSSNLNHSGASSGSRSGARHSANTENSDDDEFDIVQGLFSSPLRGEADVSNRSVNFGSGSGSATTRRLREKLEQAERRLQDASVENARSFAEQSHRIISLENENKHLHAVTDELKINNERLLQEMQAAGEGLNQSVVLQTEFEHLSEEAAELRAKLDESAEGFGVREASLLGEVQTLQLDSSKQIRSLEFEIQEYQMKVSGLEQQCSQHAAEIASSRSQIEESQVFYSKLLEEKGVQVQSLTSSLSATKNHAADRDQELSTLQAKLHEVELQHNEAALQLSSTQATLEQERRAHIQKCDSMTQEHQTTLKEELNLIENTVVAQLRLQLSHTTHEKQLLEQQLASQGHDLSHFQQDSKDLEAMRRQMSALSDASHQNELKLAAITRECESVKTQFREFQSTTHQELRCNYEESHQVVKELSETLERSKNSHAAELEDLVTKHSAHVDSVTSDCELVRQELTIATSKVTTLQTTVETLEEDARFSRQNLELLEARVEEFNEQESVSNEQILEYSNDVATQRARVRELEGLLQRSVAAAAEMTAKDAKLCADMRNMVMQLSTALATCTGSASNDMFASPAPGASGRESAGSMFEDEADTDSDAEGAEGNAGHGSPGPEDASARTTRKLFKSTQARIEKLIAQYNALQKRFDAQSAEVSGGRSKLNAAEIQLESAAKQLKEREGRLQEADELLQTKEASLRRLQESSDGEQKGNDKCYQDTLSALQDVISEVSDAVATVNSDVHNLSGLAGSDRIPALDVQGLVIHGADSSAVQVYSRVCDFKQHISATLSGICTTVHRLTTGLNSKTAAVHRAQSQHKDAIAKLEDQLNSLQTELDSLTAAHDRLLSKSSDAGSELDALRSENKKLQIVCNEFSQNNAELQNELQHASEAAAALKYQMEDADNVCSNLRQHAELLQEDCATRAKEVTAAKTHSSALQQSLYEKETELEKSSIVCKRLIVEKDMMDAANGKLRSELDQLKKDLIGKNGALKDENSRMKLEVDRVLHALNLTIEYHKVSASTNASAQAAAAAATLPTSVADKHKLVLEKLAIIQTANKELSSSKYSLESRVKLLEQEIGSLRGKITAISGEQNATHNMMVSELKKQVAEMQKRGTETAAEIQGLQANNAEMVQALAKEKQTSSSNSNKFDLALQSKEGECVRLKSELDGKSRNLELQREQTVISNDRNKALQAASEGFQQKLTIVTTTKDQLESKLKGLEIALEKALADGTHAQERAQRESEARQELASKSIVEKRETTSELERFRQECASLKKEVQAQQQAAHSMQTDKATSNRSLVTLQAQVTEHKARVQSLTADVAQLRSEQLASSARYEEEVSRRRQVETALQQQTAIVTTMRKQTLESSSSTALVHANTTNIHTNSTNNAANIRLIQELQQQVRALEEDVRGSQEEASNLKALEMEAVNAKEELAAANRKATGFRKEGRLARQQIFDLTDKLRENINVLRSALNISTGMAFVTPAHPHGGSDAQTLSDALGVSELTTALLALDSMVPFIAGTGSGGSVQRGSSSGNSMATPVAHRFGGSDGALQRLEGDNAKLTRTISDMERSHADKLKALSQEKSQLETRLAQANRETVAANQKLLKSTAHINEQLDQLQQEKAARQQSSDDATELRAAMKKLTQERDDLRNQALETDSLRKDLASLERDIRRLEEERESVNQELLAANHHRNILKNTVEKLESVITKKRDFEAREEHDSSRGHGHGSALDSSLLLQDISIIGESSTTTSADTVHALKKQLVIARYKISSMEEVVQLYRGSVVALYPDGNTYGAAQHGHFAHSRSTLSWIDSEIGAVKASFAAEVKYYELEVTELRTRLSAENSYNSELRRQFEQTLRDQYRNTHKTAASASEASRLDVLTGMLDRNETKIADLMSSLNNERNTGRQRHSQLVGELTKSLRTQDSHVSTIRHLEDMCIQGGIDYVGKLRAHAHSISGQGSSGHVHSRSPYKSPVHGSSSSGSSSSQTTPYVARRPSPMTSRQTGIPVPTAPTQSGNGATNSGRHTSTHTGSGISIDSGKGFLSKSSSLPVYQPQASGAVRLGANSGSGGTSSAPRPSTLAPSLGAGSGSGYNSRSTTPTGTYFRPPSSGNTPVKAEAAANTATTTTTTTKASTTIVSTGSSSRNLSTISQGTGALRVIGAKAEQNKTEKTSK